MGRIVPEASETTAADRPRHDGTVAAPDAKGRVLTGFRPTGPLHIGHWFGNVTNMVRLQEDHEA